MRELHWHPTADEWQYVIDGQVNVSLFGSHGRYRTETLDKGDVGYIPQGYGHSIENTGKKVARLLIAFQHRALPGDRPVAMDRQQSEIRASGKFQQARVAVRQVSERSGLHRPTQRAEAERTRDQVVACDCRGGRTTSANAMATRHAAAAGT